MGRESALTPQCRRLNQKKILGLGGELKSTQPPNNGSSDTLFQWAASFTSSNNIALANRAAQLLLKLLLLKLATVTTAVQMG